MHGILFLSKTVNSKTAHMYDFFFYKKKQLYFWLNEKDKLFP